MGLGGGDFIRGWGGDDVICAGPNRAHVVGGGSHVRGVDVVFGSSGDDVIAGGPGMDMLYGGTGSDRIHGGPNPRFTIHISGEARTVTEKLMGYKSRNDEGGTDVLFGDSGDDYLRSLTPGSAMDGGPGSDICVAVTYSVVPGCDNPSTSSGSVRSSHRASLVAPTSPDE
jgi:Ca2+-binding RTX toxin-like protein